MIDLLSIGAMEVEIMRPKPNLPLDEIHSFTGPFPSGASVITVDAAAKLGLQSAMVGIIGEDEFGDVLYNRLKQDGVITNGIKRRQDATTGVAFVSYTSKGNRNYIFHFDPKTDNIKKEQFKFKKWGKVKWLHISGSSIVSSEPLRKACAYAVQEVKKNGGKISFDPNIRVELSNSNSIKEILLPYIKKADILFPSEDEITSLFADELYKSIEKALSLGPKLVAVKRGAKGSIIATNNMVKEIKPFKVDCIDPTGAGDTYNAAFLFAQINNLSPEDSAVFANATAALSTTKLGPMEGCPNLNAVKKILSNNDYKNLINILP